MPYCFFNAPLCYVSLDTGIGWFNQLAGKSHETVAVLKTGFCPIWHHSPSWDPSPQFATDFCKVNCYPFLYIPGVALILKSPLEYFREDLN